MQSFRLFRSIIVLCRSGLGIESLILLRSLQDVTSYLLYIAEKDHDERLMYYWSSRKLSNFSLAEEYLSIFPEDASTIRMESFGQEKEEAIKYFKSKYGQETTLKNIKEKKFALKPIDAAQQIYKGTKALNQYKLVYRHTSTLSHGERPEEYARKNNDPKIVNLVLKPSDNWVRFSLSYSMSYLFYAMNGINKLIMCGKDQELNSIENQTLSLLNEINIE